MFEGSRLGIQVSRNNLRHILVFNHSYLVGQEPSVLRVAHR